MPREGEGAGGGEVSMETVFFKFPHLGCRR